MDLSQKKLFLFDIDGTLAVGDVLLPGTAALLEEIARRGGTSLFITNNSTRSQQDYVKRFEEVFGLHTHASQFVTASYLTARYLKQIYGTAPIYVQGTRSFVQELQTFGLNVHTELPCEPVCIVVGYDSELTYGKLSRTAQLLQQTTVPFYGTNPDLRCPSSFGFVPDCGAICAMLTQTTDRIPTYLGKPSAQVVAACLEQTGYSGQQTLVVGDRLYTDIACGQAAKVDTCLFLCGEACEKDLQTTQFIPDLVLEGPQALVEAMRTVGSP